MEYHSVYIIFNLLNLKYQIEEDSTIKIEDLRNTFYEYQYYINKMNNCKQELDFESELASVLDDFSCIFEIFDDEISFKEEDPSMLYEAIPEFLEDKPTSIDIYMEDAISNESIFHALKLTPPINEMRSIFEINKTILFLYELIAKLESEGKDTTPACKLIAFHKESLKEFFRVIDNETYMKIKLCLAHYLSDEAKPNINSSWYLALLSTNPKAKYALSYDKIFHYIDKEREYEEKEEIESKDLIATSFNDFNEKQSPEEFFSETCYIADELEYFLANYILYLNDYINKLYNNEVKAKLLKKKYLLLSIGDLEDTEEYYLANCTLDTLALPPYIKEWFNPNSFDFLIGNFNEILTNIRVPNHNMTDKIKANIIINLLLLKCFLDLSINEVIKKELIAEIANPEYYKNPSYSILTDYIDSIIFTSREILRER